MQTSFKSKKTMAEKEFMYVLLALGLFTVASGHGSMLEPAARNAAWKFGFNVPANHNLNEQNCGGFATQWMTNNGKCGVCGDPYGISNSPHVFPGKFATGVITKTYKAGTEIQVKIDITANHKGWFEFRLGKVTKAPVTQDQLTHILRLRDGETRWFLRSAEKKIFDIGLKLPENFTCDHCVIQWWWKCGNSWGCDANKTCGLGLGQQETFVNCADVRILPNDNSSAGESTVAPSTKPRSQTTDSPVTHFSVTHPYVTHPPKTRPSTSSNPSSTKITPSTAKVSSTKRSSPHSSTGPSQTDCRATGPWTGQVAMNKWCIVNCIKGYCPPSHCVCGLDATTGPKVTCAANGIWKGRVKMDNWCVTNCGRGHCPASLCVCS